MNILVVDDLPTNRKLLKVLLEPEGHTISEATDGLAALELLDRQKVDAVISDILMPRMDGYRLCYEIRKNPRFKELPFIVYSSTYTSPSDAKLALEVGADKYLKKPCPTNVLLEALAELSSANSRRIPRHALSIEDKLVMKEYNEALVRKLGEKNSELEQTQAELLRLNRDLEARIKERTAELEKSNAELEQANADLEAFNRSVSHDLRGPITEVQGYAQMLQRFNPDQLKSIGPAFGDKILHAARRMEGLIREFLKLAYVKQAEIRRGTVSLSQMVSQTAERLRGTHAPRTVEFIIAPELSAEAEAELLQIALENLLGNAWKFTGKCPQARIEFGSSAPGTFFVRDNGAGFDMAQAEQMFQPFRRFHGKSEFAGTGIGLTIVQRIINRHGGRIWAESKPGEGATFYFTLQP